MNKKTQKIIAEELSHAELEEIKQKWHKSLIRYSDKEVLEIFSEIIPVIPEILNEQEQELKKLELSVKKQLKSISDDADEMTIWLNEWGLQQCEIKQILKLDKSIRFLKRLIDLTSGKKTRKGCLTDEDFRNAKERSILEIIEPHVEKLKKAGNIYMACCPFHNDNTPSLAIYPNTNTFKCFGCNLGGNLIKFIMLFYNLDFIQAVKWLKEN